MRNVLYIMGNLDEEDIAWMVSVGKVHTIQVGETLIRADAPLSHLHIIMEGKFSVNVGGRQDIASLGAGDIVGEMSLVEKKPPSATVVAEQPGRYLSVPLQEIRERLVLDTGFAARLYKALAVFLSDRLRETTSQIEREHNVSKGLSGSDEMSELLEDSELDEAVLDNLHLAGARMRRLVQLIETGSN